MYPAPATETNFPRVMRLRADLFSHNDGGGKGGIGTAELHHGTVRSKSFADIPHPVAVIAGIGF